MLAIMRAVLFRRCCLRFSSPWRNSLAHLSLGNDRGGRIMAIEDETTAAHVHENSYSIIAIIAGLVTALMLCAVLSVIYYQAPDVDFTSTTLSNATKTSGPAQ